MLIEVAKHCHQIEVINVALSDITDSGLMALAGISMTDTVKKSLGKGVLIFGQDTMIFHPSKN